MTCSIKGQLRRVLTAMGCALSPCAAMIGAPAQAQSLVPGGDWSGPYWGLTGGGALLRGVSELARERFRLPVRVGRPRGFGGLTDIVAGPVHAAAVGLVLYAAEQQAGPVGVALQPVAMTNGSGSSGSGAGASSRLPTDQSGELVPPQVDDDPGVAGSKAGKPPKTGDEKTLVDKVKNFFKDWI